MEWICYTLSLSILWWITSQFTSSQVPNAKCLTVLLLTASETGTSSSAGRKSPGMQDQILAKCGSSKTLKKKQSVLSRAWWFLREKNVVNHHKPSPLEVYDWHMKKTAPRPPTADNSDTSMQHENHWVFTNKLGFPVNFWISPREPIRWKWRTQRWDRSHRMSRAW